MLSRGPVVESNVPNYSEVTVSPERKFERLPPPPPSSSSISIRGFRKGPTSPTTPPKHLTFKSNTDATNRLRAERTRRLESWNAALATTRTEKIQLSVASKIQRKLAEAFYKTINSIEIEGTVGIISLEVTGNRRVIEVPDVDSSILVRASSRPISPIAEHRNPRRGDGDYKSYAITYEQAITAPKKGRRDRRVYEGKYIRRGLLRFYISDRTATIDDPRWTNEDTSKCQLPKRFRDLRNPCMKTKGSTFLNNLCDVADLVSVPRTGRSIDFVYRMSLFEKPVVDVGGVRFTIHDSRSIAQRADASAKELSDASLSAAIIENGMTIREESDDKESEHQGTPTRPITAIIVRGANNAFTPSQVRAALLISSARADAQVQCLMNAAKDGTVKKLNENSSRALLQPTLTLLHFAGSKKREKEQFLRDLGLGNNHVALDYLERKGLYKKRRNILHLRGNVDGVIQNRSNDILGTTTVQYRIQVTCTTRETKETNGDEDSDDNDNDSSPAKAEILRTEQWVVLRRYNHFTLLHKHLKTQISDSATISTSIFKKQNKVPLLPLHNAQGKVPGTSAKKFIERRIEDLQHLLNIILSRNHPFRESPEVLKFLGAWEPLPETLVSEFDEGESDSWGRMEMKRILKSLSETTPTESNASCAPSVASAISNKPVSGIAMDVSSGSAVNKQSNESVGNKAMHASITARIKEVKLATVRDIMFDFVKHLFNLDNATFWRSSVFSALRTMAFVITSSQFTKKLTDFHFTYITGQSLGGLVRAIHETVWPGGIYFTSSPPMTEEEKSKLADEVREKLPELIPSNYKKLIGQDVTEKGLETLHEMLQNKIVLKSLIYTLLDLLFIEIFPEIKESLKEALNKY